MSREEALANLFWFGISVAMLWLVLEFAAWPAIREWRRSRRKGRAPAPGDSDKERP